MFLRKAFTGVFAATVCLSALAAGALAQVYYTGFEIPTSTCGEANCSNCRQGKRNDCPLCCFATINGKPNPNYIDGDHPAVCFSVKNTSTTVVGAWCITAGSGTQGCKPLTLNNNNANQCNQVNVWHCFPCKTAAADCMGTPCPCTPGNQEAFTISLGAQQYTCTDVAIAAQ